jgi:hypothetical protein
LVRKYGRYPAKAEIQLEGRNNEAIPVPTTLRRRLGEKADAILKLKDYCSSRKDLADVVAILAKEAPRKTPAGED